MIFVPGLSLIVNMIIILMALIFSTRKLFFYTLPRKINKMLGLFLFSVVFLIINTAAFLSIVKGLNGESNIKLVKSLFHQETGVVLADRTNDKSDLYCVLDSCSITQTTNSISDFLDSQKQDNSFEAREILAKKFNIEDYRGTAEQNLKLFALLKQTTDVCVNKN
jgi:hypothetical protein